MILNLPQQTADMDPLQLHRRHFVSVVLNIDLGELCSAAKLLEVTQSQGLLLHSVTS